MNFTELLTLQLIAHLLTDFNLQPNRMAKEKNRLGVKSRFFKWHILTAFLLSWILSFQLLFVLGAAAISISHWLIDALKGYTARSKPLGEYTFFIDQFLHIGSIVAVVSVFNHFFIPTPIFNLTFGNQLLVSVAAYIFCTKPANILIRETLVLFNIKVKENAKAKELPNAGKVIGALERWMVLTFMLLNQFSAIGFLIAAKSILRYKDTDTLKTEYVLIGTMLSFSIAILAGVVIAQAAG